MVAPGGKTAVWLVGAVHVGEPGYYDLLQKFLDEQPMVLYEGVGRPAFMHVIPAMDEADRVARTQSAIVFAAAMVDWYRAHFNAPPRSMAMLQQALQGQGRREAKYLRHALHDAWGRPLLYARRDTTYTVTSYGADGTAGGEGPAADIVHEGRATVEPPGAEAAGIQTDLAQALGLEFQLDGIDYDRAHFLNSDMSMEQIQKRVAEVGGGDQELNQLSRMLAGEGFLANVLKLGLRFIESNPKYQGMFKLMLIEMFGKLRGDDLAGAPGAGKLMSVILNDRNDVVLADLKHVLGREDAPKSLTIFYGAAHLHDMEAKLAEMGFKPAEEFWLPAMTLDAQAAGLSDAELGMVRAMAQSALQQMRRN